LHDNSAPQLPYRLLGCLHTPQHYNEDIAFPTTHTNSTKADVGELFLAGRQRIDRGDRLVVEHLVKGVVAGHADDAGEHLVALAAEPDEGPYP
jgi:hypothetical protein